jgi:hypothetical protein
MHKIIPPRREEKKPSVEFPFPAGERVEIMEIKRDGNVIKSPALSLGPTRDGNVKVRQKRAHERKLSRKLEIKVNLLSHEKTLAERQLKDWWAHEDDPVQLPPSLDWDKEDEYVLAAKRQRAADLAALWGKISSLNHQIDGIYEVKPVIMTQISSVPIEKIVPKELPKESNHELNKPSKMKKAKKQKLAGVSWSLKRRYGTDKGTKQVLAEDLDKMGLSILPEQVYRRPKHAQLMKKGHGRQLRRRIYGIVKESTESTTDSGE